MARQTQVRYVDDLDGSEAEGEVNFALDGKTYAIDLSEKNKQLLTEALQPYIDAARKAGGGAAPRQGRRRSSGAGDAGPSPRQVREWGRENGYEVSEFGRVSKNLVEAYKAAH